MLCPKSLWTPRFFNLTAYDLRYGLLTTLQTPVFGDHNHATSQKAQARVPFADRAEPRKGSGRQHLAEWEQLTTLEKPRRGNPGGLPDTPQDILSKTSQGLHTKDSCAQGPLDKDTALVILARPRPILGHEHTKLVKSSWACLTILTSNFLDEGLSKT